MNSADESTYQPDTRGPVGFVLSVVGAAFLGTIGFVAVTAIGSPLWAEQQPVLAWPMMVLFGTALAAPFVLFGAFVVGLPLTWVGKRVGLESAAFYAVGGGVLGAFLLLVIFGADLSAIVSETVSEGWLGGMYGFLSGILWWRLYRQKVQTEIQGG